MDDIHTFIFDITLYVYNVIKPVSQRKIPIKPEPFEIRDPPLFNLFLDRVHVNTMGGCFSICNGYIDPFCCEGLTK